MSIWTWQHIVLTDMYYLETADVCRCFGAKLLVLCHLCVYGYDPSERVVFLDRQFFCGKPFAAVTTKTISTVSTDHFPNRARQNRGF